MILISSISTVGPKSFKKGRHQKFTGKVNLAELDMNAFHEETSTDDNHTCKLYTADMLDVSFGREVCVVILDHIDADDKLRYARSSLVQLLLCLTCTEQGSR